jgi:hypothetical protein
LYVYAHSEVQLTTHETLGVDRLAYSAADGFFAERYGELLPAGTSTLRLDEGVYHFRAVGDVRMAMSQDSAVTVVHPDTKDNWPDPPAAPSVWSEQAAQWDTHTVGLLGEGFGPTEPIPVLMVIRGDARG